jgi:hypothetical protein
METQKICKYELMTSKELVHELKKRGQKPYQGGKRWNQPYLMRCRLREDDTKKLADISGNQTH